MPEDDGRKDDRLSMALKIREQMRALLRTPGWGMLAENAGKQIDSLTKEVMSTPVKANDMTHQEFVKGEVYGFRLLLVLPETMLKDAEMVIEALKDAGRHDEGDE